jgi:hypothetical protein
MYLLKRYLCSCILIILSICNYSSKDYSRFFRIIHLYNIVIGLSVPLVEKASFFVDLNMPAMQRRTLWDGVS